MPGCLVPRCLRSLVPYSPRPDRQIVTEDEVFAFARDTIRSVWALELLLILRRQPGVSWSGDDLVRELRGSDQVITSCLQHLAHAGLISSDSEGRHRYAPASAELDAVCLKLERIYATRPMALAKAIMRSPNENLRVFSDAFKLKD